MQPVLCVQKLILAVFILCATEAPLLAAATVGSGSAPQIQQSFQNAFARGTFAQLVQPTPLSDVHALVLGSPGLVQEFQSKADSNVKYALVKPDPNAPLSSSDTLQVYGSIYAFYLSVGPGTAGYPTVDTATCSSTTNGTCSFQLFTKNYALFVYSGPPAVSYTISDPFYTEWTNNSGASGNLGPVIGTAGAIASVSGTQGTQQLFVGGIVYSYPASSNTSTYSITGTIYNAFRGAGGSAALGFPTSEENVLTSGLHRQFFENGRIEWMPGGNPNVLFPIKEIDIKDALFGLTLNLGATAALSASVFDTQGNIADGRALAWSTSNGNVVTVQGNGASATALAVGAGTANIYVTGEGKSSQPLSVRVSSACCSVGEGAPTQAISTAFQGAITRNHLVIALPNTTAVTRLGNGYIQNVTAGGAGGGNYVICESDKSAVAYVIGGSLYAAYSAAGGFAGPLGYPSSDPSPGGTQSFESGAALAGSPVKLVPVPIAAKWLQSGAENGSDGGPVGAAGAFVSSSGIRGVSQVFAGGTFFGFTSGLHAGQAFVSSGLILARYLALSGPAGALGIPLGDPFTDGDVAEQNFETGYIDLQAGAAAAVEHFNPRNPIITATPGAAAPGGHIHIAIAGFAFGANLTVSVTGQPNFNVQVAGGHFEWDVVIAPGAKAATVAIQAKAAGSSDTASSSYAITPLAQLQPRLIAISGDQQVGLPGSALPASLVAVLRDINGNGLPGVPVSYSASPGASAQVASFTGADGTITAAFRLPDSAGVAAVALSAAGQVANFSALATAKTLQNFPVFIQTPQQGSFVAAFAGSIRYHQNAGVLGTPNGFATPDVLNKFLAANGGLPVSETGDSIVDPWAAISFAGNGGVSAETASLERVNDLLNIGSTLVLALNVQIDGAVAGSVGVNAIGVNGDGSVAISDPNPAFARVSLSDYLNGFVASGHSIQGTLAAVLRIDPNTSVKGGFVVSSPINAASSAASATGTCGNAIDLLDPVTIVQTPLAVIGGIRFLACDGTQQNYQIGFGAPKGASILDLNNGQVLQIAPSAGSAFQLTRSNGVFAFAPQTTAVAAIVNAAGFGPGLAPGGLFAIFGSGLSTGASNPVITVSGQAATVLAASPFQVNAQMPVDVSPGDAAIRIGGVSGIVSQTIAVAPTAPGIFLIGLTADNRPLGAILNQDGTINGATTPAQRGQYLSIYGTGLGLTRAAGSLQTVTTSVSVLIGGVTVAPSFSGLTPGFSGLYQVNVLVPGTLPPAGSIDLSLIQAGESSNVVTLAVQ